MNSSSPLVDPLQRVLEERAPEIAEDPRVRPTLRIGGIGHRSIPEDALPAVWVAIAQVMRRARQAAETALQHGHAAREYSGPLELFAITPLAEGADRLIAQVAVMEGYRLGAVLPFAAEEYEETFDLSPDRGVAIKVFHELLATAALPYGYGVLVLDGSTAPDRKTNSYRDCSAAVAARSDIFIAVLRDDRWDSETGLSVREAIKRGLTVVIIDPSAPEQPRIAMNANVLPKGHDVDAALEKTVFDLFGIGAQSPGPARARRNLERYRAETIVCDLARRCDFDNEGPFNAETVASSLISWSAGLNGAIASLLRRATGRSHARTARGAQPYAREMPFEPATAAPFVELFLRHHRADVLASAYAELHRSAQIITVLLGVTAASLAIASFYFPSQAKLFPVLELACLLYALIIVRVAHVEGWLERWLSYRLLAEVLRYAKYLMVCGHPMSFAHFGQTGEAASVEHNWTFHHCRQVLRAAPIAMPGRTAATDCLALSKVSTYLIGQCLDGQIAYNKRTAALRSAVSRLLQRLAIAVAVITVAFVLIQLILAFVPLDSSALSWLRRMFSTFDATSILLPAIAGALLGLRGYGEHSLIGRRSGALAVALERRREQIRSCESIAQLEEQMSAVAGALLRDVDGWLELFSDKHLEL
jgi:hypothetical protein